jgi:hypothetical protein
MGASRRCSSTLTIDVNELGPVMNCRFQDRMWSRYRQDKRGAFTLRETGQRGPTVTCSDGILSLPKPRFCDFTFICNGLRRVVLLPC